MILVFVLRGLEDRTPLVAGAAGLIGRRPVTQRDIPAVTVCRGSPHVVSGNIEVTAAF
jgi:hypothetical protein